MTIEELYEKLGGDLLEVCRRLPGRRFVERFLKRYLTDDSAEALMAALGAGDAAEGYRLALALKGVAGNLGFSDLEKAVSSLAQALRTGQVTLEARLLAEDVKRCHQTAVETIQLYFAER